MNKILSFSFLKTKDKDKEKKEKQNKEIKGTKEILIEKLKTNDVKKLILANSKLISVMTKYKSGLKGSKIENEYSIILGNDKAFNSIIEVILVIPEMYKLIESEYKAFVNDTTLAHTDAHTDAYTSANPVTHTHTSADPVTPTNMPGRKSINLQKYLKYKKKYLDLKNDNNL